MDADALDALLSPRGRELLALLAGEDLRPGAELALGTRLRRSYPPELVSPALELAALRVRAAAKFSRAADMFFTRAGLEQASSEIVARHRARRYAGASRVADLCCGIGGDLVALGRGRQAVAVDLDPLHLRMAALNAGVYGADGGLELQTGDVQETDLAGVDAAFVDPARRVAVGGRRLRPEESSPPLGWCLGLAERVPTVGIKAAPGVPLQVVPEGWETEFVSVRGDLKEATLWSPALATAARRATLLPEGRTLTPEPGPPVPCALPGRSLLDPDPAVTRAGVVEELARSLAARSGQAVWKLDPEIAFLSSDAPLATPFGRSLLVEESLPWGLKPLRARLREMGVGAVDIRKRGSPVDVEDLRRRLRLGGDRRVTVVLTRCLGKPWMLVCSGPGEG